MSHYLQILYGIHFKDKILDDYNFEFWYSPNQKLSSHPLIYDEENITAICDFILVHH